MRQRWKPRVTTGMTLLTGSEKPWPCRTTEGAWEIRSEPAARAASLIMSDAATAALVDVAVFINGEWEGSENHPAYGPLGSGQAICFTGRGNDEGEVPATLVLVKDKQGRWRDVGCGGDAYPTDQDVRLELRHRMVDE